MKSWLRRHGWLIAIAAAYLYLFPHFPAIHSANELPRVYLVKAMAEDGTFAIDRGVAKWGATADVSPSKGHHYSNKAPGSSMIVVPVYYVVTKVAGDQSLAVTLWISRVVAGVIPAVLFMMLLWGFLERFAPDPHVRRLLIGAYALGSMAMTYSILFIAHQLSAICVASAWILALDVADKRRRLRAFAVAGFLAGCGPLVDYQAAFALVPIAVHVIGKLWRWPRAEMLRALGVAAIAAAIPIAILLAYHQACFGSPWRTGYDASETFAVYHQQGFLGITELRWKAFWGSTFAADNGLFTLSPWWLLSIPGMVALWKRGQRDIVITCVSIAVIYVMFISSINFWRGGWTVGPRYITVMLPFLLPLIATQLEAWREKWWLIAICGAAMLVGVAVYSLSAATFPHWPEIFRNPFHEVTLRLLADGLVAPNAGTELGLSNLASLVPYAAAVSLIIGFPLVRLAGIRGFILAVVAAIAVIAAYREFPATKNADEIYRRVTPSVMSAHTS